jgi:hypothetical protein
MSDPYGYGGETEGRMEERFERYHPDMEAFHYGMRTGPCFVCEIVARG